MNNIYSMVYFCLMQLNLPDNKAMSSLSFFYKRERTSNSF
jgi:hypothetical protein